MLNNIAFEQITGNYWYAAYGPFRVVMMKDTGYINATKLCSSGRKEYKEWTRLKNSQQLIEALERHQVLENTRKLFEGENLPLLDANRMIPLLASPPCIFIKTANNTTSEQLISGTYVHPDLIPSIAGWISPEFQLRANRVVNRYIVNEWKTKLEAAERAATQLLTSLHHTQAIATGTQLALQTSVDQNHQLQETIKEKDTMIEV